MDEQDLLKRALYTIKKLQAQQHTAAAPPTPIAIIGLSCRLPQAPNKAAFWQLLTQGRNVISPLPETRWALLAGSAEIAKRDPQHPYWGGYLSDITGFDAYFFGLSPREATLMDPQQRLLLEVYYEAIEDAGLTPAQLSGSNTGVFASLYASQFAQWLKLTNDLDALYVPTGNATSMAANRLSYLFDLKGPSLVVDTACSSALTAIHLACLNLHNKQCGVAIVGAANLNLNPSINLTLAKAKMLSPEGQCKTFDANANGYVPGEGAGAIILKPLDKALADQDRIYAVILGSKINQDGKTNGLTAPNGLQQQQLIASLYHEIGIAPEQLAYVECHGTGTFLGDPIEIQALGQAISQNRTAQHPCFIGSVKTNLGHLEPAAGIASIIKTALALQQGQIPAHLNCATPNPHLDFARYHLRVPQQLEPWPATAGAQRLAGISGFGFGGANAHIALRAVTAEEQKQLSMPTASIPAKQIFTLSAQDPAALHTAITVWHDFLAHNPTLDLAQLCYNLQVRRCHYDHRLAILCDTIAELQGLLSTLQQAISKQTAVATGQIFTNLFARAEKTTPAPTATELLQSDATTLAYWYAQKTDVPWQTYQANQHFPQQDLPLYCWQHKQYWPDFNKSDQQALTPANRHPLQGKAIASPLPEQQFEFCFDTRLMPAIKDTFNIIHAGYYLEMLAFSTMALQQQAVFTVEDLTFSEPLLIPDNQAINVILVLNPKKNDKFTFSFYSGAPAQATWTQHATGQLQFSVTASKKTFDLAEFKQRHPHATSADSFYQRILAMGMPAGASVRWTTQYWHNDSTILCAFRPASAAEQAHDYKLRLHPGVIDGCIQPIFQLLPEQFKRPYVASHVKKLKYFALPYQQLYLWVQLNSTGKHGEQLQGNWYLLNENNQCLVTCEDMTMTQLSQQLAIDQVAQIKSNTLDQTLVAHLVQNKNALLDYLKTQIATLLAMPSADLAVDKSIMALGMNSLLALALSQILAKLEVTYSLAALLQGPTLQEIADAVWQRHHPAVITQATTERTPLPFKNLLTEDKGTWIAYRQPQQQAKIRLFCFPYGGGGASIYLNWQQALPKFIEVCPVQLPGREDRANESPIDSLESLVERLIENLLPEFNSLPFAFFGHSFGSLIAFELTRKLAKFGLPRPVHLFVSAYPDPCIPAKSLHNLLQQLHSKNINLLELANPAALSTLDQSKLSDLATVFNENGVVDYGDHLIDQTIVKALLPIFIADMNIVRTYHYHEDAALAVPITVFLGKQDQWVSQADHLGWHTHTTQSCEFCELDSGHLFIKEEHHKHKVLSKIAAVLSPREG